MRSVLLLLACALPLALPGRTSAQCDALWQEAREARAAGNLVESRRLLEATMACEPSMSAAFNLAAVLRDMGRYSDARHYLLALLDDQFGELPDARRGIVEGELERLERAMALLEVIVEPAAELRMNGAEHGTFRGSRVLTLDPGRWSLELRAEGYRSYTEEIRLESGQRVRRRYRLEPLGEGGDAQREEPASTEAETRRPRRRRRIAIALAVVGAVAAALTIGLVVRRARQPVSDPVFGNPST